MFGEFSIWAWMGATILLAIGGAVGFFISRQLKDKRTLELEEKLAATRSELANYRGEVNQHFLKTSLLVGKLTNDYREVYEHLATGAQKLCNEKPGTPKLDLPDTTILPVADQIASETMTIEPPSDITSDASIDAKNEASENLDAITERPDEFADQQTEEVTEIETATTDSEKVQASAQATDQPSPEDIPTDVDNDEDVHLGAESTPSVDTEAHKTHPAIH